jgi:hypothetical protein
MDDYTKTGPRTYAVQAKRLAQERTAREKALLDKALDKRTEAEFIDALRETMGITKDHPIYIKAIKFWRSQHP